MQNPHRQEVLNVLLAQLLQERGVISTPENIILTGAKREKRMPNVIVTYRGLRTAIEGEIGHLAGAEERALESARKRVEQGVSHIGIAIVYPREIRKVEFAQLKEELEHCTLKMNIVTESSASGYVSGNIDNLESALRNAFDQLVKEDIVTEAVSTLEDGIESFTTAMGSNVVSVQRMADVLGIRGLKSGE